MQEHIIPMDPVAFPEPFEDNNFIYEVKWDGVRMLAYIDNHQVSLVNKKLNYRTEQYPELQELTKLVKETRAILDGEIIVMKNNKPSFPSVMRRDKARKEISIKYLQQELPIDYMVFDILFCGDRDLRNTCLMDRKEYLNRVLTSSDYVHLVEDFRECKSLFKAVKLQDMEGVVAKRKNSLYLEGKKHSDWFKIKYRRKQTCVVGGYTQNGNKINSLLLGFYQDNRLLYAGKASTGLKAAEWQILTPKLLQLKTAVSPFDNLFVEKYHNTNFIKPCLTVEVEFAEWTENMHLRSPVIIKVNI